MYSFLYGGKTTTVGKKVTHLAQKQLKNDLYREFWQNDESIETVSTLTGSGKLPAVYNHNKQSMIQLFR